MNWKRTTETLHQFENHKVILSCQRAQLDTIWYGLIRLKKGGYAYQVPGIFRSLEDCKIATEQFAKVILKWIREFNNTGIN